VIHHRVTDPMSLRIVSLLFLRSSVDGYLKQLNFDTSGFQKSLLW